MDKHYIDGYYLAFLAGTAGEGIVFLVFDNGTVSGIDVAGSIFDGQVDFRSEQKAFVGPMRVSVPPNGVTIQGKDTGAEGLTYTVEICIPEDFLTRPYLTIATPFGTVNAKVRKGRDLPLSNG